MKNKIALGIIGCFVLSTFAGCGTSSNDATSKLATEQVSENLESEVAETTFDPYTDGMFSTYKEENYQPDKELVYSDFHKEGSGYDTVWLQSQDVFIVDDDDDEVCKVGDVGTQDNVTVIGTVLGKDNSCYASYSVSGLYCLWQDGWGMTRADVYDLYDYDFSGLSNTYWKYKVDGVLGQDYIMGLLGDDFFDEHEVPDEATLYLALDSFDDISPEDNCNFNGSGKMAEVIVVANGQVLGTASIDFTGSGDIGLFNFASYNDCVGSYDIFLYFKSIGTYTLEVDASSDNFVKIDESEYNEAASGAVADEISGEDDMAKTETESMMFGTFRTSLNGEYTMAIEPNSIDGTDVVGNAEIYWEGQDLGAGTLSPNGTNDSGNDEYVIYLAEDKFLTVYLVDFEMIDGKVQMNLRDENGMFLDVLYKD